VLKVLLRIFLIIEVMKHAYRLPMLWLFAKVFRHGSHGITDILLVKQ
jgi:hypothetical protein